MQKQIKVLLTLLMALFLAVSCSKDNVTNPIKTKEQMLQQKWINDYGTGYELYNITENSLESAGSYNNSPETVGYQISIEEISWNSDNTSGIIYGKYTIDNNNNNKNLGKWYAVSFKNLTDTSISICGASKKLEDGSYDSSAETLQEAKTKFTEANGYFGYYSACTVKQ
ncbi:hypothetical protein BFL38_11315 [Brachyspira hampsonii]|uniref:Lipoprotein n=1 Tax=Brachyspira hampsonii TaxID=1287055 RepID=A0A1E5NIQ0_9SPIR|nr:hypothetical protein [Brachyspira hampsonii]OEJ16038.1 hypothetical protein BFL38_11315 [Brachyspira hampsonii]